MAVSIRLRRMGSRNDVTYRVVAADRRSPRDGRFIELLGWYNPRNSGQKFKLDVEKIRSWESKGAILSDTVKNLLRQHARQSA